MSNERFSNIINEKEFLHWQRYAQEYIESFAINSVFLHKVDKNRSSPSDAFDEALASEIYFQDPIEINCIVEIKPQENKAYSKNQTGRYEEYGNLIFYVPEITLAQKKISIEYGDYVSYFIKGNHVYFEVVNNDFKNISNDKTFIGYEPVWKTIECTAVDQGKIMDI